MVNPYADQLSYGDDRLQSRRDQPKYLSLIKAVALLRQLQKPLKVWGLNGGRHANGLARPYIEVDGEDIRLANELTTELLGQTLDELSRPGYDLLMQLERMTQGSRPTARQQSRLKEETASPADKSAKPPAGARPACIATCKNSSNWNTCWWRAGVTASCKPTGCFTTARARTAESSCWA